MPVTTSAKQRMIRNERARLTNRIRLGKFRAAEKNFRKFCLSSDVEKAKEAFVVAQSQFAKAVKHGLVHHKRCSAKVSQFSDMLKAISA